MPTSATGLCHAVATEDADALTFGANIVVRNIFSTDIKKRPMFEVNLGRCLEQLDIDMEKFIDFCILSGCDYTDTIKGVGSKTAFQVRRGVVEVALFLCILSTPRVLHSH
jgi:flap endonuclease-1